MTSIPTTEWLPETNIIEGPYYINIPVEEIYDDDYEIVIGLYDKDGDQHRLHLNGINDGQNRFRLGTLRVQDDGRIISYNNNTAERDY